MDTDIYMHTYIEYKITDNTNTDLYMYEHSTWCPEYEPLNYVHLQVVIDIRKQTEPPSTDVFQPTLLIYIFKKM